MECLVATCRDRLSVWVNLSPVQASSRSLLLDLGEDRLVLTARPSLFHLDVFLPFLVDQENSVAQYNGSTQVHKKHLM